MGKRRIIIKQSVAESIARIAWYIESKGMIATAENFSDSVYDFFIKIADERRRFSLCRDKERSAMGYKCINFRKKYTVVIIESDEEVTICEFIPSRLIQ
jgi:hypothetical protein